MYEFTYLDETLVRKDSDKSLDESRSALVRHSREASYRGVEESLVTVELNEAEFAELPA